MIRFRKTGKSVLDILEYKYKDVRFLYKKGTSDKLYIFFSSFAVKNKPQSYNYVKMSTLNTEASYLYILDSDSPIEDARGTYFLGDKKLSYLNYIKSIILKVANNKQIYYFGSNKGASGAILSALEIGRGIVFINTPQIKIFDYLNKYNPQALKTLKLDAHYLNFIIQKKIFDLKDKNDLEINISFGVLDENYLNEHIKDLFNVMNKEKINYKFYPLHGSYNKELLEDYSTLLENIINTSNCDYAYKKIYSNISYYYENNLLKNLYTDLKDLDFEKNIRDHIANNLVVIYNRNDVFIRIKNLYGIKINIYLKKKNGAILRRNDEYDMKNHTYIYKRVSLSMLEYLTIFIKNEKSLYTYDIDKSDFNLLDLSKLLKESTLDKYKRNNKENQSLSRKILFDLSPISASNDDIKLIRESIVPSSIDSADAKYISNFSLSPSYKVCISNNIYRRSLESKNSLILKLDSKNKNNIFIKKLGFEIPIIYSSNTSLSEVMKYEQCVIKPTSGTGSQGVFIKRDDEYYDLRDNSKVYGYEEFTKKYSKYSTKNIIIEELIEDKGIPAKDYRVYTFYGKCIAISEIIRVDSENQYCEYNLQGDIIHTGQYSEEIRFIGDGFNKKMLNIAKNISLSVPFPFLRIDFLAAGDILKVGELTPTPGRYSRYSDEYNYLFGSEYLMAQTRLNNDLLNGKKFIDFMQIN